MVTKLLPAFLKRSIITRIQTIANNARENLYLESRPGEDAYCIKPGNQTEKPAESGTLPVPPKELWLGYGANAQEYVSSGKHDVTEMVRILGEQGFSVGSAKRILEFGCGAGRMIRHLPELAPHAELWGVDLSAQHIRWSIDNLSPIIHFATTTTVPHLPFEDRTFDLIYCGSVFTHIEDIQETWLLELGRILRPAGKLYITIHDENTVRMLEDTKYRDFWLTKLMDQNPVYSANKNDFNIMVVGRGSQSQVFYSSRYFQSIIPPIFRWVSLTRAAYGYQSAVILEKLGTN